MKPPKNFKVRFHLLNEEMENELVNVIQAIGNVGFPEPYMIEDHNVKVPFLSVWEVGQSYGKLQVKAFNGQWYSYNQMSEADRIKIYELTYRYITGKWEEKLKYIMNYE